MCAVGSVERFKPQLKSVCSDVDYINMITLLAEMSRQDRKKLQHGTGEEVKHILGKRLKKKKKDRQVWFHVLAVRQATDCSRNHCCNGSHHLTPHALAISSVAAYKDHSSILAAFLDRYRHSE